MRPVLFEIGPLPVAAYGLLLTLAFCLGAWLGGRRALRAGMRERHAQDIALWGFISGVAGARLLFAATERPELLTRPAELLRFWDGGLSFFGGLLAAVSASLLYARRNRIPFLPVADVFAPVVALGLVLVRTGCFMNGCCAGRPVSWGIVFPALGDGLPRHPAQLYEAAAAGAIFLALLILQRARADRGAAGEIFFAGLALYGAARLAVSLARETGAATAGLPLSRALSFAFLAAGLAGLAGLAAKSRGRTVPLPPSRNADPARP